MDADFISLTTKDSISPKDGQDGCEAILPIVCKSVDVEKRTVEVVASSERIDRDGEIITMAALRKAMKGFMRNPVVLACHTHRTASADPPVIGRVLPNWRIVGKQLIVFIQFAETDLAEKYWILYRDKFMRAVSIGFRVKAREEEIIDGQRVPVFTEIELYELSCVAVGANPDALSKSKQRKRDFVSGKRTKPGIDQEDTALAFAKAFLGDGDCEGEVSESRATKVTANKTAPRPDTIHSVLQQKETELCRQFGSRKLYDSYKQYVRGKNSYFAKHQLTAEERELFEDIERHGPAAALRKMQTGYYDEEDELEQWKGLSQGKRHS